MTTLKLMSATAILFGLAACDMPSVTQTPVATRAVQTTKVVTVARKAVPTPRTQSGAGGRSESAGQVSASSESDDGDSDDGDTDTAGVSASGAGAIGGSEASNDPGVGSSGSGGFGGGYGFNDASDSSGGLSL